MITRRLAAILAADVVGFSKLISEDESGTLAALREIREDIVNPVLAEHGGRIFKLMGDGMLAEFPSAVQALKAAIAIQERLRQRNTQPSSGKQIDVRIGVHQGDVVVEGADLLGDGVNIAARLQTLAEPRGICISARVHEDAAGKVALEAQDLGEQSLKNIGRLLRAYRVSVGSPVTGPKADSGRPALALPNKPSIAVLSFQNMSGDPEQEYFADGMVEDIIAALSRIRWLFVIARSSSFAYKGHATDAKLIGRELGVRYILEGSIRKAGGRVRITGQLIDAATGGHLWADRYDRDLADIFALQDEITKTVAAVIEPTLMEVEQQRVMRKPPGSLDTWETYQRGLWHFYKYTEDDNNAAQAFFRRAIELDPNFAPGHYGFALAQHFNFWVYPTPLSWADVTRSELEEARLAVSLDDKDSMAHVALSFSWVISGEWEAGIAEARIAVSLNPNSAWSMVAFGHALGWGGFHKDGLDFLRRAMRASPHDPLTWFCAHWRGMFQYFSRDYTGSVESMKEVIRTHPEHGYRGYAAALAQLGRTAEAKEALEKAIDVSRAFTEKLARQRPPWFRPDDYAHYLDGLSKAGYRA